MELEESELQETNDASVSSNASARLCFTTRRFAERAFLHGKSWQGHKLQFMWLTSISSGNDGARSGNLPAASNMPSDPNVKISGLDASNNYHKFSSPGTDEPEQVTVGADADSVEQNKDSKSTSASS